MNGIFSTCGICHGKIGLKPCNCVLQNNKHDLGIAEAIGFDKGYKAATAKTLTDAEFDNIFANGKRLGVLETEDKFCKAKTLTDEEVIKIIKRFIGTEPLVHEVEQAILKKASEG